MFNTENPLSSIAISKRGSMEKVMTKGQASFVQGLPLLIKVLICLVIFGFLIENALSITIPKNGNPKYIDDWMLNTIVTINVSIPADKDEEKHRCSGTIISKNSIVTSAHCFYSNWYEVDFRVLLHNSKNRLQKMRFKIADVLLHPNYSFGDKIFDLALVTIEGEFPDTVNPAKLSNTIIPNSPLFIAGGGISIPEVIGGNSGELQMSSVISIKEQSSVLKVRTEEDRKACGGDSGGPLFQVYNGTIQLLGVASALDYSDGWKICNDKVIYSSSENFYHDFPEFSEFSYN